MLQTISHFGRILGSLLYQAPDHNPNPALLALFQSGEWQTGCIFLSEAERSALQAVFEQADFTNLNEQYQHYFIGPNELPVAPWGSVYLDKEQVIFGDSLLALRQFMQANGINMQLALNEPEDHFGLMLMMTAYLAEQQSAQLGCFLAEHFLPWAYRFCELFRQQPQGVYPALVALSEGLLKAWQAQLSIEPTAYQLYR